MKNYPYKHRLKYYGKHVNLIRALPIFYYNGHGIEYTEDLLIHVQILVDIAQSGRPIEYIQHYLSYSGLQITYHQHRNISRLQRIPAQQDAGTYVLRTGTDVRDNHHRILGAAHGVVPARPTRNFIQRAYDRVRTVFS